MTEKKRYLGAYGVLLLLVLGAACAGLACGSVFLEPARLAAGFAGTDRQAAVILTGLRLPRVLGAALAGAALAAAGTLLQCVTDNGLCAPNVIGVNSGAGFAVILLLCFAPGQWRLLPAAAFFGALTATAVVVSIAFHGGYRTGGTTIVLAGVAVSALLGAGISFLSLRFPDVLTSYTAFSVGGFAGVSTAQLAVPAQLAALAFALAQTLAPRLNLLCLGDEVAASLGVRVKRVRAAALVAAAALCAAAVSFAGLLGFVGLLVPHIVRAACGHDIRFNLSLSALAGAVLVILADLGARVAFAPSELPAGIVTALLGAPFFLYLLLKKRRGYGGV